MLTLIIIFIVFSSVVAILWVGSHDVLTGRSRRAGSASCAVCGLCRGRSRPAQRSLGRGFGRVGRRRAAVRDPARQTADHGAGAPRALPQPSRGDVSFENVSFAYPMRPDVLAIDNVSFAVKAGEKVAIVGPSGAGKSTLFHLLLRFYDPARGTISFDGVPVNRPIRATCAPHRAGAAGLGGVRGFRARKHPLRPARRQRCRGRARRRSCACHRIHPPPARGFEAQLGERGVTLSGGQRQRIAIARAILRDAPLLLLDEATSALDAETETLVQTALEELMRHRTTLVIAHRLATVLSCDRIMVMDQGRLVEQGTHACWSQQTASMRGWRGCNSRGLNLVQRNGSPSRQKRLQINNPEPFARLWKKAGTRTSGACCSPGQQSRCDRIGDEHAISPRWFCTYASIAHDICDRTDVGSFRPRDSLPRTWLSQWSAQRGPSMPWRLPMSC